ncbi:MAG: 3D domain-containing protein, partial [Planctomycetes bacterium]|nr:3D domain-containing protein [Planctomycetota bacterium]
FRPASLAAMALVAAIVCVLMGITGVDITLADGKVMMLSTTTATNGALGDHSGSHAANHGGLGGHDGDGALDGHAGASAGAHTGAFAGSARERGLVDSLAVVDDAGQEQWETVRMRVTAYCTCRTCCGKHSNGITANNHKIRWGDVFVASDKMYRFGTEMRIPGYNQDRTVKVLDRGRVIKGYRLDVFFNSHSVAKKWGVKYLDVEVKI